MKTVKLQLADNVLKGLTELAEEIGMKPNAYIQYILGQHVKVLEYKPPVKETKEDEQ